MNYDRTEIVDTNGTYAKVIFTADPDSDVSLCLKTEHLPSIDLAPAPGIKEDIGPSGVRALPLAAGINVGGHCFRQLILVRAKCVQPAEQIR